MKAARPLSVVARWFDNRAVDAAAGGNAGLAGSVDWMRVVPFIALHLACLAASAGIEAPWQPVLPLYPTSPVGEV